MCWLASIPPLLLLGSISQVSLVALAMGPEDSSLRDGSFKIPLSNHLVSWLDSWGPKLRQRAQEALRCAIAAQASEFMLSIEPPSPIRVGTDCSGCEAPIWALKCLGLQHTHCFSSDTAKVPQDFIRLNLRPLKMYEDMMKRDNKEAPWVHVYIVGFPCTPFSRLHHGSRLLKEQNAKPFYGILRFLQTSKPYIAVLENVEGISRVTRTITKKLKGCGYLVTVLFCSPTDLGEPVRRPRFYFVCVRADVASASEGQLQNIVNSAWDSLRSAYSGEKAELKQRTLSSDHKEIRDLLAQRQATFAKARSQGYPGQKKSPKWPSRHAAFKVIAKNKNKVTGAPQLSRPAVRWLRD